MKASIVRLGAVLAVLGLSLFGRSLAVAGLTVGDGTGTDVDVSGQITRIVCHYGTKTPTIVMSGSSGSSYEATYNKATVVSAAWCQAQTEAVAKKLVAGGLSASYDIGAMDVDSDAEEVTLTLAAGTGDSVTGEATNGTGTEGEENSSEAMDVGEVNSVCTSILPASWCEEGDTGINGILNLVLNLMTMGVGILAAVGLVLSGIQWMTARDNESQVVKAKSRIFNIVIGLALWGIMYLLLSWLTPGGLDF